MVRLWTDLSTAGALLTTWITSSARLSFCSNGRVTKVRKKLKLPHGSLQKLKTLISESTPSAGNGASTHIRIKCSSEYRSSSRL